MDGNSNPIEFCHSSDAMAYHALHEVFWTAGFKHIKECASKGLRIVAALFLRTQFPIDQRPDGVTFDGNLEASKASPAASAKTTLFGPWS